MKQLSLWVVLLIIILAFLITACSTDTKYTPPTKVESNQTAGTQSEATQHIAAQTATEQKAPEPPKVTIFKVGETATDGQLKVTVNGVRFARVINEKNNEFEVAKAPAGEEYAILDLTIENELSDKTQTVSTLTETTINDQDGYNYDVDFTGLTALSKSFKDGEILPNMKKRGELAYLVPANATSLKFIYKFDLFKGTSAVFNIK